MTSDRDLIGLDALLRVGRRGVIALATASELPPALAVDELIETGAAVHADRRFEILDAARPVLAAAAGDDATVERLEREREIATAATADPEGATKGDRLWLGRWPGLASAMLVTMCALTLVAIGGGSRGGAELLLALVALVAFLAADWAGRGSTRVRLLVLAPAVAALATVGAEVAGRGSRLTDLTVLLASMSAGALTGRGRRYAPRFAASERAHRIDREIALARERATASAHAAAALQSAFATTADQIGLRVLGAVDDYLGRVAPTRCSLTEARSLRDVASDAVGRWSRTITEDR